MPIGKGIVLIGMGERTSRPAVTRIARELFAQGGASRVIGCQMPRSRAAMHLDTVFSFCDRGSVGDLNVIVPQLTEKVKARKGG
jgi:arginine deiminase